MNLPGHARASVESVPGGCGIPLCGDPYRWGAPDFHLPILARSVTYLRVLLEDGIVDLDLASSVISLDPGLAYRLLQLANRDLPEDRDRIWQLPLAIVTAGRASLDELLDQTAQIEISDCSHSVVQSLVTEAVVRACLAQALARELASSPPRKCFLSGLLYQLPALVSLSVPGRLDSHAMLLSDMCHSLPVTVVKAALAQVAPEQSSTDPIVAIVAIAQELLHCGRHINATLALEELAGHSLWRPWQAVPQLQRLKILERCCDLARWAARNLYGISPWEFMAQLETSAPGE